MHMPNKAINRINKFCDYFPCHKNLEDCTFCYCPFYPCENQEKGEYKILSAKRRIWSCSNCSWIHSREIVDKLFKLIKTKGQDWLEHNQNLNNKDVGVIILGHGSRLKEANNLIPKIIRQIKKNLGVKIIEPAYLQLYEPDLHKSVKKVVEKGCKKIIIAPFFLFTGNHVTRDIPKAIAKEAKIYKSVKLIYAKNIGDDSRIEEIVSDSIKNALKDIVILRRAKPDEESFLKSKILRSPKRAPSE